MSNSPNMSYCAFENTELAVNQLIRMLSDAIENGEPLDMSTYELRAYNRMKDSLAVLIDLMEQHDSEIFEEAELEYEEG